MPSRVQTVTDAIRLFNNAVFPSGLTPSSAWLGIYQVLLWCEEVNLAGVESLPHIIEADALRAPSNATRQARRSPSLWQQRAERVARYLARELACSVPEVAQRLDLLMQGTAYRSMQRQNTLGIAFAGLIRHVLERFGPTSLVHELEVDAGAVFPGVSFPGRSTAPRIDILTKQNAIPRAVISAKWSVRHDRLNDITNECPVYKAAYSRIYRQADQRDLRYYVITNEYAPARLAKMLDDVCVDGVVHVHKPAVVDVCGLDARLHALMDLADFVSSLASW